MSRCRNCDHVHRWWVGGGICWVDSCTCTTFELAPDPTLKGGAPSATDTSGTAPATGETVPWEAVAGPPDHGEGGDAHELPPVRREQRGSAGTVVTGPAADYPTAAAGPPPLCACGHPATDHPRGDCRTCELTREPVDPGYCWGWWPPGSVAVEVDEHGNVVEAEPDPTEPNNPPPDLLEQAIQAATTALYQASDETAELQGWNHIARIAVEAAAPTLLAEVERLRRLEAAWRARNEDLSHQVFCANAELERLRAPFERLRAGSSKGGKRRLETMTPKQRSAQARKAALARWNRKTTGGQAIR